MGTKRCLPRGTQAVRCPVCWPRARHQHWMHPAVASPHLITPRPDPLRSCDSTLCPPLPLPPGQVWVDLGGGTGENVAMMSHYIDLSRFKQIYVVDLCKSLCQQVRPAGPGASASSVARRE